MSDEVLAIPASFAQQRLWFLDQLVPGNPFYNIHAALPLNYIVDADVLRRSINEIIRRHETLRTWFAVVDGETMQVVEEDLLLDLPVIDLRGLETGKRNRKVLQLATEEAQKPFNLAQGPLLRTTLLRISDKEYVFLLTISHIISDGWSMGVFFRELTAIYGAFIIGASSPLPELPIQYADFAVWQRQWLQGDTLEEQIDYWKQRLAGLPVLRMPTDRSRPDFVTYRGAYLRVQLSSYLRQGVVALAKKEGCTLFMVLLAVFKVLLQRYTPLKAP